ncbi:hypothetical protein L530_1201 [Bordetella bronchiseptica MO211]|nr:hypothetical protein L530_1201 [Bordetella bronchiseptica MO211]KCV44375.1 hypothetical protein L572_1320 [Bordetella bronchiseptica 345]
MRRVVQRVAVVLSAQGSDEPFVGVGKPQALVSVLGGGGAPAEAHLVDAARDEVLVGD